MGGCNLIAGIEKGEFDRDLENPDGPGPSPAEDERLAGWSTALRFEPGACSLDIDVDEEDIVACVLRASCDPLIPSFNVSDCVTLRYLETLPAESCASEATSCDEIQDCLGREVVEDSDLDVCADNEGWVCDGNDAVYCDEYPYKWDCERFGSTCTPPVDPINLDVFSCSPADAANSIDCSTAIEGEAYCSGDEIYTCVDGIAYGYDCTTENTLCREAVPGEANCEAPLVPCDEPGEMDCDGEVVTVCSDTGNLTEFDCLESGTYCYTYTDEALCEAGSCFTDVDCVEGCYDTNTLRLCVGATPVLVDCNEMFGTTCYENTLSDATPFAGCSLLF